MATNIANEVTVGTSLEAAQIAGQLASRTGGAWTVDLAARTYRVARSTHPVDMASENLYLTIRVAR